MNTIQSKSFLTYLISIFSLFVVGVTLLSIIFPALLISNLSYHSNNLEIFEIGYNAPLILLCNFIDSLIWSPIVRTGFNEVIGS